MMGLLKFELTNMFKSVSFLICGIIMMVLSFTSIFFLYLGRIIIGTTGMEMILGYTYSGLAFLIGAPMNCNYILLVGIMTSIAVCSGYSQKTYRNIWSRGFSRGQLYVCKMVAVALAAAVYAVGAMLVSFTTASIIWEPGTGWDGTIFITILLEIFMCVVIAILFASIAFTFKNMGISIVIAVMGPSLLSIGATVIDIILQVKRIDISVSKFIIFDAIQLLIAAPYDITVIAESFLCATAYFISFGVFGYFAMRKDEI